MVVTREEWTRHGDLLAWTATTYPGLTCEGAVEAWVRQGYSRAQAEHIVAFYVGKRS